MKKEMILRSLDETDSNRTRAAEIFGISRRTPSVEIERVWGETMTMDGHVQIGMKREPDIEVVISSHP
jgi:hypothetical protein